MECPRGWLLAYNDNGFTVPFFLKVRYNDVYYSSSVTEKFYLAEVLERPVEDDDSTEEDESANNLDVTIIPAGQTYKFTLGGWDTMLCNDESFTMTKEFYFDEDTAEYVASTGSWVSYLSMHVDLPFSVLPGDGLCINITKMMQSTDLLGAQFNIVYDDELSDDGEINGFTIQTYKYDNSEWISTCLGFEAYQTSKIVVTVSGNAYLGIYSHVDDDSQIGAYWDGTSGVPISSNNVYNKVEVNNLIQELRDAIANGEVITAEDIIALVSNFNDANTLMHGMVLDTEDSQ